MFSTEEYIVSWLIYLSTSAGLLLVFWRSTGNMGSWHYFRQLLRLSIAVLLLTPFTVNESSNYLAPAWTILSLDMIFAEADNLWRAGGPLLIVWSSIAILHCLVTLAYKISGIKSSNK